MSKSYTAQITKDNIKASLLKFYSLEKIAEIEKMYQKKEADYHEAKKIIARHDEFDKDILEVCQTILEEAKNQPETS